MRSFISLAAAVALNAGPAAGAPEADSSHHPWWAFQKLRRPSAPSAVPSGAQHVIDGFVSAGLSPQGMSPAPLANDVTLTKRLHYDLAGLPPDPASLEAFEDLSEGGSVGRLADRLLASPRFGERWARHWLDVVRFAETNGYERDALKPNIWKYRDWVIDAFNADLPYDLFVRQQLAGDEIPARDTSSVIATGMLRAGTWNDEPNDPHEYKYERLEDMVDVVGTAFLGLTVKCARCHDHKFDPISHEDYHRFAAAFWPGAIEPRERELMGGPTAAELGFPEVFGWTDLTSEPAPFHLLLKGDPHQLGAPVRPGHLSLVSWLDRPLPEPPRDSRTTQRRLHMANFITDRSNPLTARVMINRVWHHLTGRGLVETPNNFGLKSELPRHQELLDWLAADFMEGDWTLKRVIRQVVLSHTYRQASVHPQEALLATRDSGNRLWWKMNRRRVDAEVLRDSMLAASGELDLRMGGPSFYPELAPEALEGFSQKEAAWQASPPEERRRRSVYMMTKRHLLLPLMTAFDFPNSEKPCGRRDVTTVAPQALALLNNAVVHHCSETMASRILNGSPSSDESDQALTLAWSLALGRLPLPAEAESSRMHVEIQRAHFRSRGLAPERSSFLALASLCHALLNTNEFAYVD